MTDFSLFHPKLNPLINNILTHSEPTQWLTMLNGLQK